jgi:hypothetical protein
MASWRPGGRFNSTVALNESFSAAALEVNTNVTILTADRGANL